MKPLRQLDNASLGALKTALDAYQQFETRYPEPVRYFQKIIEHLLGLWDKLDVWALRELINQEEERRRTAAVAIVSVEAYQQIQRLGEQERRVLKLLAEGYQSVQIANLLGISYRTIANHKGNIAAKLGLGTAKDLVRFAITHLTFL